MKWQSLGASLARQLQHSDGDIQAVPVHGGDISQAFRLECGVHKYFVKVNRADLLSMFVAEKAGLDAIRCSQTIRVPEVFLTGHEDNCAYIVMEYIELGGRIDAGLFTTAVAAMHCCFQDQFGFECDNTIGSTPQHNTFNADWIDFWRQHRLGFQLELAQQNGFDAGLIDAGNRLAENLGKFFKTYHPRPSLLHGDLWSGNQGADLDGNPVIFDPACYYGDHEADLAMMELFGHPGEYFFSRYSEHFPIDSGYAERRELYNLYHVLNHANLFGGGYAAQAQRTIERLLAL
jgi:protein-ribulosamine 3-kinase